MWFKRKDKDMTEYTSEDKARQVAIIRELLAEEAKQEASRVENAKIDKEYKEMMGELIDEDIFKHIVGTYRWGDGHDQRIANAIALQTLRDSKKG